MLCMSKTSKMYIKGVLRYINTRDQSNVEGVEDRSNTPKGCNAMYVEDVEDVHSRGVEIHKYKRSKQCRRCRRY